MNFYDPITEFIFVEHKPQPADMIFVPGSTYGEIAVNAARLYHQGLAPYILVSGKYSIVTGHYEGPGDFSYECDFLADLLMQEQVPAKAILKDPKASYTYENAIYSRELTDSLGLSIQKAILSCQAYHARRSLLYYQLLYPETEFFVCPAKTRGADRENWYKHADTIDLVLGEVERCGSQFHNILKSTL